MKFTDAYFDSVTKSVTDAEEKTSIEIVVVIHPFSGNYRDVNYLFGGLIAWAGIIFMLFSEWNFHPYFIPFEIILLFAFGAWVCSITPLRRLLTGEKRRDQQVKDSAKIAYSDEGVTLTRARTGVLLYYSVLEQQVEVMADSGVCAFIPEEEWKSYLAKVEQTGRSISPADTLLENIKQLGELGMRYLPATEDNPDEIPNRPRIIR